MEKNTIKVGDKVFKYTPTTEDKSKEKLKAFIKESVIKYGGGGILDLAEVAVGNRESYNRFRAKSLRILNNIVRNIQAEIDLHYDVKYTSDLETLVTFNTNGKGEG